MENSAGRHHANTVLHYIANDLKVNSVDMIIILLLYRSGFSMEEINVTVAQFIRSLLLQAWRERWSEEKWNISMNKIMPYISGVEGSVLSGLTE